MEHIVDAEDMSGHWPRTAPQSAPPDPVEAWKRCRKALAKKPFDFEDSVPGLRRALENRPKEPTTLDVESAAALLHASNSTWRDRDVGIEYLCSRMSPVDVLKALLLATTYHRAGWDKLSVKAGEPTAITTRTFPYWRAFLRASAEDRSTARAFADKSWSTATVQQRGALLACFPDRADWALELSETPEDCEFLLLGTLRDLEALRRLTFYGPQLVNVVENLPLDQAVEYFDEGLERATDESGEKPTANALARICTPAAAALFVKHMRKKVIRAHAVAYFTAHPELAPGALGELAKKKTKLVETAREILDRAERSGASADTTATVADSGAPAEADSGAPATEADTSAPATEADTSAPATKADSRASATKADSRASATEAAPEAELSEVPAVLRDPPWPKKRKASKTKPLENLAIPTEPCRMHWPLLSRQRHLVERLSWAQGDSKIVSQSLSRIKEAAADLDFKGDWNLDGILAIHGDGAAHAVASVIQQKRSFFWSVHWEVLESPAIATRLDLDGAIWRWLRRYPEAGVAGLVPATLMAEGKLRDAGEARLRWMHQLGHGDRIRQAADGYGDKARAIIDAILEADPHDEVPAKAPKMGKSYRPAELRAPVLKNGKRLPLVAVERLCEMLAFSPTVPAYVGVDEVREACTAESLSDLSWDLAKGWSLGGSKQNELWMLHAVEHYGNDQVVRRLTSELNGSGIASMLGDIATDAALMELGNIKMHCSTLTRPPKYAEGHEEAIHHIALKRGVSVDELEEEYVPTLDGLDDNGAVTLDLGPTKVRVTFDAHFLPLLHDENGERLKALPKGKKSDPARLKVAKSALKQLEQDVTVIGLNRIQSLLRALVQQRSWAKERFERLFVQHPLMRYVARALIWQSVEGPVFRVAEDGTYADIDDAELALPDAPVRLCHPLSLSAEERSAWAGILADYEQLQPIEQLTMDVSFGADDADETEIIREVSVPYAQMPAEDVVLPALGWITTSQHSGFPIGDEIVILYVRHPKLWGRVLDKELKQIPLKDADPRARIALARAFDAFAPS